MSILNFAEKWSVSARLVFMSVFIGVFIFCIGDRFYHIATGTLSYIWQPMLSGQSIIVWLLFILGSGGMLAIAYPFTATRPDPTISKTLFSFLLMHVMYACSGHFDATHPQALLLAFIGVWLIVMMFEPQKSKALVYTLIIGAVGAPTEGLVSYVGVYNYTRPDFALVPYWLFALYLAASASLLDAGRWVRTGRFSA